MVVIVVSGVVIGIGHEGVSVEFMIVVFDIIVRRRAIHLRDAVLHGLVFQGSSSFAESAKTPSVRVGIGSFLALLEAVRMDMLVFVSVLVVTVVLGEILVG